MPHCAHFYCLSMLALTSLPTAALPTGLHVTIGPTHYHESYTEFVNAPHKFMREEATMIGADVRVDYGFDRHFSLGAGYDVAVGSSTYTGSKMGQPYGTLTAGGIGRHRHHLTLDTTYRLSQGTGITAGIAWRKLYDHMEKMAKGYRRENTITYLSLGIDHCFPLASWTMQPALMYHHLIGGQQFTAILGGIYHQQQHGHGMDVAIAFKKILNADHAFTITPFLHTWEIADSDKVNTAQGYVFMEPHNKTEDVGVQLAWTF
jgi:hypothetical protein